MKKIITLFIFITAFNFYGQRKEIDSLKKLVKTKISDSTKVKAFGDLCWYYSDISTDSAFYYGNKALKLAIKSENLNGEAQAYNDFGIIYYKLSNFDLAVSYYKRALIIRKKTKDTLGIGSIYNKMGIAYQRIFKMDSAIYYNTKALEIYEKTNNTQYVALIKNNIANILFNLKQYNKALNEHLAVAKIRKQINDEFGLVHSYTNIGNSYLYLKDTVQSELFYKKGIEIAEKNNYKLELSTLYNNYGSILKEQSDYDNAIEYFNRSLKLREELNDNYGIASVVQNIGALYLSKGKINLAEINLRRGLQLALNTNAKELEMKGYESLLTLFAFKKNTDSILHYQKLRSIAQDSLLNTRVTQEIAEIQEKYNTEKKEKEIALQKEQLLNNKLEIKTKNTYALLMGSALLILSIVLFSLYKRQQHKKREYASQLKLKEAQTYSKLQGQRLQISRDLHDNIGSQLTFIISSIDNLKFLTDATNEKLRNKLTEINAFASNTIAQLRDTIWAMNKDEITFTDLYSRILAFVEKAKSVSNIHYVIDSNVSSEIVFTSIKGINIFRVIQEAINNTIKYAEASEITISFTETSEKLELLIKDNGKGFDKNMVELGNGLENMQHRIQEIGGEITIDSKINNGTFIKIVCSKKKTEQAI